MVTLNGKYLVYYIGSKKVHHYCLAKEEYIITDHKPLVAVVGEDVATLSQVVTRRHAVHPSRYPAHFMQGWPSIIYSRLVIPSQPCRE